MDSILSELKLLSAQTAAIPDIVENMKKIQLELAELKSIKDDLKNVKTSVEYAHQSIAELSAKVTDLSSEVDSIKNTKDDIASLRNQLAKLNRLHQENDQKLRQNNIEIKGVPMSNSENLFTVISKIGERININLPKEQINYIARVPMRNDNHNKTIICCIHNRYLKEDFVAAAKKCKLTAADLGLSSSNMIFVNDHLTVENKILLNKTKLLAKDRGFSFVWIKNCKILVRKNPTSPVLSIQTEEDLKKYFF